MISPIVTALLLFLLLYYLTFLWHVRGGLSRTVKPSAQYAPFVSIIVPARNEQETIGRCLESLTNQAYDADRFEIIVVDDHSTDRTVQAVETRNQSSGQPEVVLCRLSEHGSPRFGKPAAISSGIEQSKGEIILCTDADCTAGPGLVNSMVRCFQPDVVFVAGPVREQPSQSFLSEVQRLEFMGLIITAAGLIGSGRPIICNGANIAYRRQAFERVSGFGSTATSCDDETLMQRMVERRIGKVVFNSDSEALVHTRTPSTVLDFLNQRTRWAAKRGHYEDKSILVRLLCLFAFFLTLFGAGIGALMDSSFTFPFLVVLLVKMVAEFVVLRAGGTLFNYQISPGHFLIAELFHVPYITLAGLIGQFSSLRWKDRRLVR